MPTRNVLLAVSLVIDNLGHAVTESQLHVLIRGRDRRVLLSM